MTESKWDRIKKNYAISFIAYRKELRKFFIKILILLNVGLCVLSVWRNNPSMIVYFLNVVYLLRYYRVEYPETSIKKKERFKDLQ